MAERSRRRPWLGFGLLLVVLAVALAVGSGVGGGSRASLAQRAAALEADLRCPSCQDLSVADSSASSAVAVRREVTAMLRAGASNQQVDDRLVAQYGPSILLRPPTSGLSVLVWIVPGLVAVVGLGSLGLLFWRRSRDLSRLRETAR